MLPVSYKQVCRLNVPMNDTLGVSRFERVRSLNGKIEECADIQWLLLDALLEGCPVKKLHSDEGLAFMLSNFINGANAGMVQSRSSTGFAAKTFQRLLFLC